MISRRDFGAAVLFAAAATDVLPESALADDMNSQSSGLTPELKTINAFFATNRKWVDAPTYYSSDFRDTSDGQLYESGQMSVVKYGNPPAWMPDLNSLKRYPPNSNLAELETASIDPPGVIDEFLRNLQDKQKRIGRNLENAGLVFIHGYAFSFLDVFGVIGQIAEGYNKPDILSFCWPSFGDHLKYGPDQTQAYSSGDSVAAFLTGLLKKLDALGDEQPLLNIVVHSMGNRVLSSTMQIMKSTVPGLVSKKPFFEHALLMAADEDYRALSQSNKLMPLVKLAKSTNVYVNSDDGALFGGQIFNGTGELGAYGPANFPLGANIYFIDVHDVALNNTPSYPITLGHQYFRLSVPVMQDIRYVLAGKKQSEIPNRQADPDPKLRDLKFKITAK